jgi:hypothetical protein
VTFTKQPTLCAGSLDSDKAEAEQLEAAAQVTPADLEAAREFWSHWAPLYFNALLDAETKEGTVQCSVLHPLHVDTVSRVCPKRPVTYAPVGA